MRHGVLSPRYAPVGLILLESIGYKSGTTRATPLLATHLGRYTLVSTVRGKKSFWVRNLQKQPSIRFHRGGRLKEASAQVFTPDDTTPDTKSLPPTVAALINTLLRNGSNDLALAVLRTDS